MVGRVAAGGDFGTGHATTEAAVWRLLAGVLIGAALGAAATLQATDDGGVAALNAEMVRAFQHGMVEAEAARKRAEDARQVTAWQREEAEHQAAWWRVEADHAQARQRAAEDQLARLRRW